MPTNDFFYILDKNCICKSRGRDDTCMVCTRIAPKIIDFKKILYSLNICFIFLYIYIYI